MRTTIAMILNILISTQCFGITEYQTEDKLFVWAESGLNMRESPDIRSKVIAKIPFKAKVVCKGQKSWYEYLHYSQKIKDKVQISEGNFAQIELKGSWVKVKYEDLEGYVFDSYLSKYKPSKKEEEPESLFEYLKKEYDSIIYLEKKDSTLEYGRDKIVFSNGVFLTQNYASGGFGFQMNLPDFSIEEAFLLIRHLDKFATGIIQNKEGTIIISQDIGGYTIESFKNMVIISGEWSC